MLQKIKSILKQPHWEQLRDIRLAGFAVFGVLVLLASWSGVNVIETNYNLQKQIAQLDQQNQVGELQNTNLKLENEYYNSTTYLELTARKQLGKGAPGESLLLVPKDVAVKHAKLLPQPSKPASVAPKAAKVPRYKQNFNAWIDFFLHRGTN